MRLNAIVAVLTILLFSPAVLALSLGEAQTQSHLNQPLKATIVVRAVKYDERDTIRAIIPDAEKFKRSGMRRDAIVDNISIDVLDGTAEDELVIHLRTQKRIKEPFLSFLVEVRWLGGSVIREYTLLLDPAAVADARKAQEAPEEVNTGSAPPAQPETVSADYRPAPTPVVARSSQRQYGPIKRHETLWSVAFSQRTDSSLSMDQMQLAIYQANPQAFEGNINQLRTGSVLIIPANNEISAIDPDYAKREVVKQKQRYQPPAPAPKPKPRPVPAPVVSEPMVEAEIEEIAEEEVSEADVTSAESAAIEPAAEQSDITEAVDDTDSTLAEADSPAVTAAEQSEMAAGSTDDDTAQKSAEAEFLEGNEQLDAEAGDIEMPSVWVDDDTQDAAVVDGAPEAEADAEPVVDDAPAESGGALSAVLSPVTLGLALVLLLVILVTYWWYRKRKVTNVGSQFAYAADDEAEETTDQAVPVEATTEEAAQDFSPASVWNDSGEVPDSIDEYTASTPGADDLDLTGLDIDSISAQRDDSHTVELDAEEASPIRDMTGEEIDYLGEADVHLAYGLYDEAASVLQRGINENPNRSDLRVKLLEVFHSGNMAEEFLSAAESWHKTGGADENDWAAAVKMGQEIAPASPLFAQAGEAGFAAEPLQSVSTQNDLAVDFESSELDAPAQAEPSSIADEAPEADKNEDLEFDLTGFDLSSPATEVTEEPEADNSLELPVADSDTASEAEEVEFEGLDVASDDNTASTSDGFSAAADADDEDLDFSALSLSDEGELSDDLAVDDPAFDAEEQGVPGLEAINPSDSLDSGEVATKNERLEPVDSGDDVDIAGYQPDPELDQFAGMSIADDAGVEATPEAAAASAEDEEEVSVKLDLARAYLDMGEPEMAKTLLDEVVEMGSAQQQQEARDLLSRAG